jgi:hypothetical protein
MSSEQPDMGSDGPETPSSPPSIHSDIIDVDRGASEKTSRPNKDSPPIESVGPKVPLDKVYLMGTQAAIFYEVL